MLRRIASKCAEKSSRRATTFLVSSQVGCGTRRGAETAVDSFRNWMEHGDHPK